MVAIAAASEDEKTWARNLFLLFATCESQSRGELRPDTPRVHREPQSVVPRRDVAMIKKGQASKKGQERDIFHIHNRTTHLKYTHTVRCCHTYKYKYSRQWVGLPWERPHTSDTDTFGDDLADGSSCAQRFGGLERLVLEHGDVVQVL